MDFADLPSDAGLTNELLLSQAANGALVNSWLITHLYIVGYSPFQADVTSFKALKSAPDATKHPHAAQWYKSIASETDDFTTLPGDASKEYSTSGPEATEVTLNPSKAPAAAAEEDDDEVVLFGVDDEEDAGAARAREERLTEYKRNEGKTKPAAKSVVTMDVKPWALEESVRGIDKHGVIWGASKLVHMGFGIETTN